ncbi:glycine oxidase ThiO [Desertibacillus haloalkaliphilus]|uniref:glycine oxidase ThiO n=1 Tax=Desertibacillus haloalkaliphilus TaxID=1328930 RepID=UPI001C26EFDF|nr:glycine oxidase ThiO [Desertibacillus haloalkaliphilus]MBU8905741.1 glycine oxidase ThiO [Desertibacillus haloalkaliphilus]
MGERIVVLGGGIIGLATAFECQRRGYKVTILEKVTCGGQASGAAAGMLAPYSEIEEDPDDFFRLCLASLKLYPKWQQEVKDIAKAEFEYTNSGSLHCVYHEADLLSLESRQQWQGDFGAEADILQGEELYKREPELSKEIIAAMYYPEESHVFAPDYVKALEQACRNIGVQIYEQLEQVDVVNWEEEIHLVAKDGQSFTGDRLVICSGAWASELEGTFGLSIPVHPIRGQICAYDMPVGKVKHILYSSQGYLVPKGNGTLVNGASEDIAGFNTTVTERGIRRLTNWNKNVLPYLANEIPFHEWAGLRPATQDGYPLIGKLSTAPHVIFATGHYRNGILLSPVTAHIVADLLEGQRDRVPLQMFAPERFS